MSKLRISLTNDFEKITPEYYHHKLPEHIKVIKI